MDRRHFFRTGMSLATATAMTGISVTSPAAEQALSSTKKGAQTEDGVLKFSVFADIHHFPGSFYSQTPEHLIQIQERAIRNNCDIILHLGDFTHNPPKVRDFVDLYNNFKIPSYHCLGNHDQDGCAWEKTLEYYKLTSGHYYFDKKGFRFVIFDPNYILLDGKYIHYTNGNYFKHGSVLNHVPPEQVEWMKDTIENSPFPCILASHQSLEREVDAIANRADIRKMIHDINKKYPGRVRLCMNGHYHRDFLSILDNVVYFDVNSASFDWLGNNACKDLWPEDLVKKYPQLKNTVVYNDPVHAVITMKQDGTIKIEGMESSMFMGIDRAKAKVSLYDTAGRPVVPKVSSAHFQMIY